MSTSSPPIPLLPARYTLVPTPERALLGKGGAAEVWRVRDQALGVDVALKILRSEGSRVQARLEREAVLASRVVHPNVIALHDVGRTPDNKSFLAFALANGGSMLEMSADPPPWAELRELLIQVLSALGALHSRGILHLDVKLSNLLLHREGRERLVWLADLGVARALWDEEDNDTAVVGTVSYMSTERLTGRHAAWCPATDLFALGAVAYRILSGRLPFPARDPSAALAERQRPPLTLPLRDGYLAPAGLDAVILPMLEPDLRARPDLAADVIRALQALPEPGRALPPSPGRRSAPGVPPRFSPPPAPTPSQLRRARPRRKLPQTPALLLHREIDLVGRDTELETLWRAARTAMRSRRPLLLELTGPWGVGRTRLVEEFTRTLEEAGLAEGLRLDYSARQAPDRGLRGAWRRILPAAPNRETHVREVATLLGRDRGVSIAECVHEARALAAWIAPPEGAAASNRSLARALFVEHLERRAWRGLSWLWLEDAHLAEENDDCWPIVDLLLTRNAPVLILTTTRADAPTPSMAELRARHPEQVRELPVHPIGGPDADTLVGAHLPLDPELTRRLARHAGGNGRVIREILTWWMRVGALQESDQTCEAGRVWTLAPEAPPLPRNRRDFARELLREIAGDPDRYRALLTLALAGPGTPDSVIARVAGAGFDRLVVDGLIEVERGAAVAVPPELAEVVFEALYAEPADILDLHSRLAAAWAAQGDDPAVIARVGVHRAESGDLAGSLPYLDRALRTWFHTWPTPDLADLARRTLAVAARVGQIGDAIWTNAALTLSDALWRQGQDDEVAELDAMVAEQTLDVEWALRAQLAASRRGQSQAPLPVRTEGGARLRTPLRAEIFLTRALRRANQLDAAGALDDLHEALAHRPEPAHACRAHLLHARLIALRDPMVSWHEALRAVEVARDHGLLRLEVLAWGLVAEPMVALGRATEAIERLRAGVARLNTHGDVRAAAEATLHLAGALRAASREDEAQAAWVEAQMAPPPAYGTIALAARESMAIQAALERRPALIRRFAERPGEDPAARCAWSLLLPLAELLSGAPAPMPSLDLLPRATVLGVDGQLLMSATGLALREQGRSTEAEDWEAARQRANRERGIEGSLTLGLVDRLAARWASSGARG